MCTRLCIIQLLGNAYKSGNIKPRNTHQNLVQFYITICSVKSEYTFQRDRNIFRISGYIFIPSKYSAITPTALFELPCWHPSAQCPITIAVLLACKVTAP